MVSHETRTAVTAIYRYSLVYVPVFLEAENFISCS